jgi:hypothetical protein
LLEKIIDVEMSDSSSADERFTSNAHLLDQKRKINEFKSEALNKTPMGLRGAGFDREPMQHTKINVKHMTSLPKSMHKQVFSLCINNNK